MVESACGDEVVTATSSTDLPGHHATVEALLADASLFTNSAHWFHRTACHMLCERCGTFPSGDHRNAFHLHKRLQGFKDCYPDVHLDEWIDSNPAFVAYLNFARPGACQLDVVWLNAHFDGACFQGSPRAPRQGLAGHPCCVESTRDRASRWLGRLICARGWPPLLRFVQRERSRGRPMPRGRRRPGSMRFYRRRHGNLPSTGPVRPWYASE